MAKLFTDIDEFKEFVSVTRAMDINSLSPKINHALKKYIEDWLGPVQTAIIVAAHAGVPTPAQAALIEMVQPSLANFAWLEYIPLANVSVDDAGIARRENANYKTAYSGQIEDLKSDAAESGYDSLEYMLEFLEDNEGDYPAWVASDGYTKNKEHFINTAAEFMLHYPITHGRQTFKALTTTMDDVECFTILPTIGKPFFDYLKNKIATKQAFTSAELDAVKLIRKAIAQFTVHEVSQQSWVKFTDQGVMYLERKGFETSVAEKKTAKDNQISTKVRHAWTKGNQWLDKLKDLLDNNLDDYPLYRDDPIVNPPEDTDDCDVDDSEPTGFHRV